MSSSDSSGNQFSFLIRLPQRPRQQASLPAARKLASTLHMWSCVKCFQIYTLLLEVGEPGYL